MNDSALLIIDVQLGMFDENYHIYNGTGLLDGLRTLINQARASNTPIIFVQHNGQEEGDPLRPDQPGWALHPALPVAKEDVLIQKLHPDSFQGTNLQSELQRLGVTSLVVAGMQTEFCVDTTCRRAYSLGYHVILARDAHTTFDTEVLTAPQVIAHHNQVLSSGFVTLKNAAEIQFDEHSSVMI